MILIVIMIVSAAIYIAIMTFPTIANKTARIAIMTSSCRLPSSLLAAGMPLEFRLTLDFLPTDYVEDLRWSICHLTLYRRAGVGDGRAQMRRTGDHGLPMLYDLKGLLTNGLACGHAFRITREIVTAASVASLVHFRLAP
ncbi:unnamed protein product, partial [Symbiodinium sp. KB8]